MQAEKIAISSYCKQYLSCITIDVRSPSEYAHAHIPNAINICLFNDEQRKLVGTTYKQQSREDAIKIGLDYFGPKMRQMVEQVEGLVGKDKTQTIVVHCWRGGMRSAAVAWLLNLYGFNVKIIVGGYKAFRNWVLQQFSLPYNFTIIGGYTGSGKTELLQQLYKNNLAIIDLENISQHKGSALGGINMPKQTSQEMFENKLALAFAAIEPNQQIFIEDESQRIGLHCIPNATWQQMRLAAVYFLKIPFNQRLQHVTEGYGKLPKTDLVNAVMRIQKRLGGLETKNAISFLLEDNISAAFEILLKYYDKFYEKGLHNRDNLPKQLIEINCSTVDAVKNAAAIINAIA
jgi:tRNA 2-selenouridine synthase